MAKQSRSKVAAVETSEDSADTAQQFNETAQTLDTLVVKWNDMTVDWASLPEVSRVRIAVKGIHEILSDSTAMSKDEKAALQAEGPDALAFELNRRRAARLESLYTGKYAVSARGPRLPTVERVMRQIAEERLKLLCESKHVALPTGENKKKFLDRITELQGAEIRTEAEARIARQRDAVSQDSELGALFDEIGAA